MRFLRRNPAARPGTFRQRLADLSPLPVSTLPPAHESAPEIYARLAQRTNTLLTSTTSAGVLYETDLRLRPNGAAGLLIVIAAITTPRERVCQVMFSG